MNLFTETLIRHHITSAGAEKLLEPLAPQAVPQPEANFANTNLILQTTGVVDGKYDLTHTHTHLWVVHVPQQAALLRVQDEVSAQEPAGAFILLDVQKAADAILSVHVRHRDPVQLGPPWGITGTLEQGGGNGECRSIIAAFRRW